MKTTLLLAALCGMLILPTASESYAQQRTGYIAPQDTVKTKRKPNETLNQVSTSKSIRQTDTRMLGAATYAAGLLSDSASYDLKKGLPITQLFKEQDLAYFSKAGLANVVALFEQVNKLLPGGKKLTFLTDSTQETSTITNPLSLTDLRVKISSNPASIASNRPQWQENVYQAYMARDYGTRLENTITITSATREMREEPSLELIAANGSSITLAQILRQAQANGSANAERNAVAAFRNLTFPNGQVSKETANENYKRALFTLINLQQGDFNRHTETTALISSLSNDLQQGANSKVLAALKSSTFFDSNVPGNLGPVLVTETDVVDPQRIATEARNKAMELMTLTALHYGERDAVKLYKRLIAGEGSTAASSTNDFTKKRLGQLTYHGTEKIKSLGFGPDKTANMTSSDLVLVAVAAPALPVTNTPFASLSLSEVGKTIVSTYNSVVTESTRSMFQLNPRAILGSRYTTYQAKYDPIDYARGAAITQNGVEFRLESDLYLGKLEKMLDTQLKPFIYPQFGIILGTGDRKVGYDGDLTSNFGAIPRFKQNYLTWGGHLGLNVGPVLVGVDGTLMSTESADDPYKRFFDLSQSMTYYRYSFLARLVNLSISKKEVLNPTYITFDFELAGETNNEGTRNRTRSQDRESQVQSKEWVRSYERARPGGVYDPEIANELLLEGDVKASYIAANYAALHLGLVKSGFQFKVMAGLYNREAFGAYQEGKGAWLSELARDTFRGYGFGSVSLTYNFGSGGSSIKSRRVERNSVINGVSSADPVEESTSRERVHTGLRTRAVFMNRK
ncbi:MAG: hypothetical protein WKF66_00160 [Pedobacter sp.]